MVNDNAITVDEPWKQMLTADIRQCREYARIGYSANLQAMKYSDIEQLVHSLARVADRCGDSLEWALKRRS